MTKNPDCMKQKFYVARYFFFLSVFVFLSIFSPSKISAQKFNFCVSNLSGVVLSNPTSLQFGPDKRLYVAEQGGLIKVLTLVRNGSNSYSATATETISLINK